MADWAPPEAAAWEPPEASSWTPPEASISILDDPEVKQFLNSPGSSGVVNPAEFRTSVSPESNTAIDANGNVSTVDSTGKATPMTKFGVPVNVDRMVQQSFMQSATEPAIREIPRLPASVEDALDTTSQGGFNPIGGLIKPSAVFRAGVGVLNFFQSPAGVASLGIGALPSTAQKLIAGVFAAQAIKETPDKIHALIDAKTDDEKRQAQADLLNNTLMLAGGATHALGTDRAGARPAGEPDLNLKTAIKEGDLMRSASSDTKPEVLDPLVQTRDILAAQVAKEPTPELQRTLAVVNNQLANVPQETLAASRARIAQQASTTPAESPGGKATEATPSSAEGITAPSLTPLTSEALSTVPVKGSIEDLSNVAQGMGMVLKDTKEHIQASIENLPAYAKNLVDETVGKVKMGELGNLFPEDGVFGVGIRELQAKQIVPTGDSARFQKIVDSEISGLHEAQDEGEALDHMEGIEDDKVREAIAKQYGIETEGKSANDLNTEIADKAIEVKNATRPNESTPAPAEFEPPEDEGGLPKTNLYGGGTMTRRIAPLGITPKLPPFLEHVTDFLAGLSKVPQFVDAYNAMKGFLGSLSGRTFPRLTVLNQQLGELGARWISSKIAAKPSALLFSTKVMEGLGVDPVKFGSALTEDNLRSVRKGHEDAGDAEKAAAVKTTIGAKGSPFKTESEYQDFLNDPAIKEAIARHKAMWDSVIDPMYKKAMGLDPDLELPARGLQTGARINLHAIMEGEKAGDKIVTVGQGNLLGTMRKQSIFGRQATGAGDTYGSNYHGIMENTFAKQLEIANKNAFEDALVERGFAKVDKPGQDVEINGRKAESYPYRRQTVVIPGEDGTKSLSQSRNLYIDPRLKGEYESGANILRSGIQDNKLVQGFSKIINNAALTGLTDATVHISNLATALFTRPSGGLLSDTLLSAAGRADIPVTIAKTIMKGFSDNMGQLKELAEIGALRDQHQTGSGANPLTWPGKAIQWMDRTTRLALDDTYKKLAESGLVEKSETNRREFINQVGQYNKRAQPAYMRILRDSGASPFVTAGKTFNALAIKTATLNPGLEAASLPAATALRVNQLAKIVGAGGLVATLNYLITGQVGGRPGVPIGAIDTGKSDRNSRPLYIKAFDMMGLGRAMRITGARGAIEASRNGLQPSDVADAAGRDVFNTVTAPFIGPPARFLATLGNIPTAMGIGKPVPAVAPGESQLKANAKQAVIQASPLLASIVDQTKVGGSLMESMQRQLPRYLPQSGKPPEMMAKYPEIVHRAQAREFTNDIIGQARKMEDPTARNAFIQQARNRLAPADRGHFDATLKYSHIH